MEYMIKLGLEGLKRVLGANSFTESAKVQQELEEYELQNTPILAFLQEVDELDIINRECKEVHRQYKCWCAENGFLEMTLSNFSKELNKRLGLVVRRVRLNGKQVGMYVK